MKLLMICHMAVPVHNAGGETTIHAAFRELVRRGHEVHVVCRPHTNEIQFDDYEYEGVKVVRPVGRQYYDHDWIVNYAKAFDPDILLTHLDLTTTAEQVSLDIGKPLAHFVHNNLKPGFHRVPPNRCQLAIYNTHWVAESFGYKDVPSVVVHPVVEPDLYRCERGTKVTLVNPTPGKGADTFYALSKALPDVEFLCVKSVYGEQIAPPNINANLHPNVETMEHVSDAREYLRKTKIILMPSEYESFGRVPVEAACAGIPAIVSPTPGLKESMGSAAVFIDRDNIQAWKIEIEKLLNDDLYFKKRSDAALALAASLDPAAEFDALENALKETVQGQIAEVKTMKMWTATKVIYETSDGRLVGSGDGRIPRDAVRQAVGIGGQIPEEVAIAHGLVEGKSMPGPAENKAIPGPEENKLLSTENIKRRKRKVA